MFIKEQALMQLRYDLWSLCDRFLYFVILLCIDNIMFFYHILVLYTILYVGSLCIRS